MIKKEDIDNNYVCSTSDNPLKAFSKVNNLSINVLTDDQKDVLEMIEQLSDDKLKKKVIESFIKGETSRETSKTKHLNFQMDNKGLIEHQGYSLNEVFKRMELKDNSKSVILKDLKTKINDLKLEIKKIKKYYATQDKKIIDL